MRARRSASALLLFGALALPARGAVAEPPTHACPALVWRTLQRGSLRDRMLVSQLDTLLAISSTEAGLKSDDKTDIIVALPDLGGDARREMIVRLDGQAFCDAGDCAIYLLRKAANGHWIATAELKGTDIATTGTRTNGYCDLQLQRTHGHDTWNWTGAAYACTDAPTPAPPTPAGSFP